MKSKAARATKFMIGRINILKELALILEYACILKAGAVLEPRNITTEHARSAPRQTTDEHVFEIIRITILHSCLLLSALSSQLSRGVEQMYGYGSLWTKYADKRGTSQ